MHHLLFNSQLKSNLIQNHISTFLKDACISPLIQQIKQSTQILFNHIQHGSDQQKYFFKNYSKLIRLLHQSNQIQAINLTLHWINVQTQRLIELNKINEAIKVSQLILPFIHTQNIDRLLFCNSLSNLILLYYHQNNLQESLDLLIKNIDICIESIKAVKKQNPLSKNQIQLFAILLVNSFKNGKNIIKKMLSADYQFQNSQQLKDLQFNFNKLGYEACVNYLGKKSYFIQFFNYIPSKILKNQQNEPVKSNFIDQQTFKSFQSVMLSKLEMIQTMLKQKQNTVISDKISQKQDIQIVSTTNHAEEYQQQIIQQQEQTTQVVPINNLAEGIFSFFAKGNKLDQQSIQINGWNVEIQFMKLMGQTLGKLQITCNHINKKLSFQHRIGQKQLQKILNLIYLQQTILYEHSLTDLPANFITVCIKPYFSITEEGQIQFYPKSKGITRKFIQMKFYGCKCHISINHIKGNTFRAAICPIQESGSIYLDIQLTSQTIEQFFEELIDPIPYKIFSLYENSLQNKKSKKKNKKYSSIKSIKIIHQQNFKNILILIIESFESFLSNSQNQLIGGDIFGIIEKQDWYFKYLQATPRQRGIFFRINYLTHPQYFSIYAQQNIIQKQIKSTNIIKRDGTAAFDNKQLKQIFGINFIYENCQQKIKKIQEIMCQKYYLNFKKNIENLIRNSFHQSIIDDNLIIQKNFNFHNFYVDFVPKDENNMYLCPITISIVTVSNIYPIGLKITHYDPEDLIQKGYFINICAQDWSFENIFQQEGDIVKGKNCNILNNQVKQMFRKHNEMYSFAQKYFLGHWMQIQGFIMIMQKVKNKNSILYLEKNLNKIVNWTKIFQDS